MRRLLVAVVAFSALAASSVACTPTVTATGSCLTRPTIVTFSGAQPRLDGDKAPLSANATIDARQGTWAGTTVAYPMVIRDLVGDTRSNMCLVGGSVFTSAPDTTPWSVWHDRTGVETFEPSFQIIGTRVTNEGDGLDFEASAHDWIVRGVRLTDIHDDCIQNDQMNSGLLDDSLLDGCYSAISAMGFAGSTVDGRANTMTITNDLIRLGDMPTVSNGPAPGHAGFFKFAGPLATEGRGPSLVVRNTIFMADSTSQISNMGLPYYQDPTTGVWHPYPLQCSNNTMVWLGPGNYPVTLPSCFKITTDPSVWTNAVSKWNVTHGP